MVEKAIDRFIRVQVEKIHVEVQTLINAEDIYEEARILGRIEAEAGAIRFAIKCKENDENN